MEGWVETIITGVFGAGGGGFFGWFFTRKKSNAEAKGSEMDNVEHAIKIWRESAQSLQLENEKLSKKVEDLSNAIEEMRLDLITVHRENKALKDYLYKRGIDFKIIQNESTIIFNENK
jgi:predicted  nucleic acid-binding Zn-ribbon protein